jgi:hypothetical protein
MITMSKVSSDRLMDGTQELRFVSINSSNLTVNEEGGWYLPDDFELTDAFESLSQMGVKVVRIYTFSCGNDTYAGKPKHVTGPGQFDETMFRGVDKAIQLANQYNIRLIIPFIDAAECWGGPKVYAEWRGKTSSEFYTDTQIKNDFKSTINYVLNRTNYYTGVRYKDDKAILAWETGNEMPLNEPNINTWTAEMAAYIKSIDSNHLVADGTHGIRSAALNDNNIDIVSNHYYSTDGTDFVSRCSADRNTSRGYKVFIVGEYGIYPTSGGTTNTTRYHALVDEVVSNGTSGCMIWNQSYRSRYGGFNRNSSEDNPLVLRWPGFPDASSYDEIGTLDMIRQHAYSINGQTPPSLPTPIAPVLLSDIKPNDIRWKGSAGARYYTIERATSLGGPFTVIATNVTDDKSISKYGTLYEDTSAAVATNYYYRMKAQNASGSYSAYSNVVGPVSSGIKDDLNDFSKMHSHTANLGFDSSNPQLIGGDTSRLYKTTSTYENIVYNSGTDTMKSFDVDSYFWTGEGMVDFKFYASYDGQIYNEITPGKNNMGGDWIHIIYSATLPLNTKYLKIEFRNTSANYWNPQISSVQIKYGAPEVGSAGSIYAEMNDGSYMFQNNKYLLRATGDTAHFEGDDARVYKTTTSYQSIIYRTKPDMTSFVVDAFFWNGEPVVHFKFYVSYDGSTYSEYTGYVTTDLGGDWKHIRYSTMYLPAGVKCLKIEFRSTSSNTWAVQLSRVRIGTTYMDDFMNDYSKMYSHTANLGFDSSNPQVYWLAEIRRDYIEQRLHIKT